MSQSLVKNYLHLVFSTKLRNAWLPVDCRSKLFAYQSGILKNLDSTVVEINGVEDHVHILFLLSKNHALKTVIEEVKKGSSKWMKTLDGTKNVNFYWQGGYGAFSVSQSKVEVVRKYIQNQEEHHRKVTFQDELRELFRLHEIDFDERYGWD